MKIPRWIIRKIRVIRTTSITLTFISKKDQIGCSTTRYQLRRGYVIYFPKRSHIGNLWKKLNWFFGRHSSFVFFFCICKLWLQPNHLLLNNFVYLYHIPHNPTINPVNTECGHNIYLVQLIRTTNFNNQFLQPNFVCLLFYLVRDIKPL